MTKESSRLDLEIRAFLWKVASVFFLAAIVSLTEYEHFSKMMLNMSPVVILIFGAMWTMEWKYYGIISTISAVYVSGLIILIYSKFTIFAEEGYTIYVLRSCTLGLITGFILYIFMRIYLRFKK